MARKRVLLVDDETHMVEMVKMRLEANGYDVIVAYDGDEALYKAKKERPDLIILDIMLPKKDGYEVCVILKKDAQYADIPVMMFTAKTLEHDLKRATEAGADDCISKPFEPEILLKKIEVLINNEKRAR